MTPPRQRPDCIWRRWVPDASASNVTASATANVTSLARSPWNDGVGGYYSNDNRRLYCLNKYQESVPWNVKVAAKVYVFPKALERFVDRYAERRQLVGDDNRDIRVRGQWRRW